MATWDQVRRYALALPGTAEGTSRGSTVWTVNKKLFVWERPLRKSDLAALGDAAPAGAILGVRTADLEMKDAMLASNRAVLQQVIVEAWIAVALERAARAYLDSVKTPRLRDA